jgi:glucoamylase
LNWEQRAPAEVQLGNGTLLATFDANGELEQLFAPRIDATQARLGVFRTSVVVPTGGAPEILRIEPETFNVRLELQAGSQRLLAEYQHKHRPLKLRRRLSIHPTDPILLDRWEILEEKAGILHESVPWMGNATSAHCSLYHPTYGGLVHHRGRRWVGIMKRGAASQTQWCRVGHLSEHDRYRMWGGERVFVPVGPADLSGFPGGHAPLGWDHVVQGPSTFGAFAIGPGAVLELLVICAESERHLGRMLEQMEHLPTERFDQMVEGMSRKRMAPAAETLARIENPRVRLFCERSIDVLHALQDSTGGALMAAAEVDPHSRLSGGYGYSWPRDGGYLASALDAFGFHDRVQHYFKFLADTQDPSGAWWQRYLATGHAGPSWGRIQIDEPATVVAFAFQHYRRTRDLFWLEGYWPVIRRGLDFLEAFHAPEHPMGMPSHDLWEERMGIHAYSLAAVSAAFRAGAYLARELGERRTQAHYHLWSRSLNRILHEKFLPRDGAANRSFVVHSWDYQQGGGHWDAAADVSMLGLMIPFHVLHLKSPQSQRIIQRIREQLWLRGMGGLLRYEQDTYRGGHPWILTTLWLGMAELGLGNRNEARECFQWAMAKATPLNLFAEQVHKETGKPFWVIPLGWSHAMYLLFVKDVLDRGAQHEIWEKL